MAQIIDGKSHAQKHEENLRSKIQDLQKRPVLVSFLIGDDPGSVLYTDIKQNKAFDLGIDFQVESFLETTSVADVEARLYELNDDPDVNGVMIQLPLPEEFGGKERALSLINLINPSKDVDGLRENSPYLAATVRGILSLLDDERIDLSEKKVVVVGAKGEVGSRLMVALSDKCKELEGIDRGTENLKTVTLTADVLISSTGQMNIIKGDMVKEGAVVIDVGSEKLEDGRVVGDVDFESVAPKAFKITPVPGGVGPMTVISLMENVVEASIKQS
jgi:methylenetetrahydrofolate dehydrogenase (NADP+) / methenyltetrahydrofolate cyclohydrolase